MAKRKQPEVRRVTTQQRLSRQHSHSSASIYLPIGLVVFLIGVGFVYFGGMLRPDTGPDSIKRAQELIAQKEYDQALIELRMAKTSDAKVAEQIIDLKSQVSTFIKVRQLRVKFQKRWKEEYLDLKETMTRDEKRRVIMLFRKQYKNSEFYKTIDTEFKAFASEVFN